MCVCVVCVCVYLYECAVFYAFIYSCIFTCSMYSYPYLYIRIYTHSYLSRCPEKSDKISKNFESRKAGANELVILRDSTEV